MAYRPKAPTPEETSSSGSAPLGVRLLALLVGTVFLLMAGKSVVRDFRQYYKLTPLDELYVATPATWLKVEVRRDASGAADFYPDVLFDARVDGQSVWGWRLSFEEAPRDSAYWAARLAGYKVGDTVTAFVNPRDPKDAFIEKKSEGVPRIVSKTMLGAAFGLFGATLVVLSVPGFLRRPADTGHKGGKPRA